MTTNAPSAITRGGVLLGLGSGQADQPLFDNRDERLARERYGRLYFQITREHVASFDHIAKAWWISHNPDEPVKDDQTKRISRFLEYEARRRFRSKHGVIEREYWSQKPFAACALTKDGCVHSVMNATDPELILYEDRVHQLCRDAHRTFEEALYRRKKARKKAKKDLHEIGDMLYIVLTRLILAASVREDERKTQHERDEAFTALRIEWKIAHASVEEMIQRQARFEYFIGVGLGALITIPVLGAAGWASVFYGANQLGEPGAAGSFTAAIIGGAMGAVISVTQRMTTKTKTPLVIDFTAPRSQKIILGALRPIVGAVFGAVIYFAIIGGLLALEARTGHDASISLAFFAVAGFAAGFSERFATDVLQRASSGILPTSQGAQPVDKPDELSMLMSEQSRHAETPKKAGHPRQKSRHPRRQTTAGEKGRVDQQSKEHPTSHLIRGGP